MFELSFEACRKKKRVAKARPCDAAESGRVGYALKENNMSDITITIIDREGTSHEVQAPTDMNMNLMEVVRLYELAPEGTIGICGGMAMCASCQCYVLTEHELPEMSDDEDLMLAEAFHVKDSSRLGCQLHIHPEMEGLRVELAPES